MSEFCVRAPDFVAKPDKKNRPLCQIQAERKRRNYSASKQAGPEGRFSVSGPSIRFGEAAQTADNENCPFGQKRWKANMLIQVDDNRCYI